MEVLRHAVIAHHGTSWCTDVPMHHFCSDDTTWIEKVCVHLCALDFCIGVQLRYSGKESSWVMHEFGGCNVCEDGHIEVESDSLGENLSWNKAGRTDMFRYDKALLHCYFEAGLIRDFKQASLQARHWFRCMPFLNCGAHFPFGISEREMQSFTFQMLPKVCAKGCTKLSWHLAMRNVAQCPKFALWVL